MPHRLLLLADDRCFKELREAGGLPDTLLVDGETDPRNATVLLEQGDIVRRDPAMLMAGTPEERDRVFAQLMGSVVCHLFLLENPGSRENPEKVVLGGRASLAPLAEWYARFRSEACRSVREFRANYRYVLILVSAEELRDRELPTLRRLLTARGEEKVFDDCYVMLQKLECGEGDIFHSRYVWPIPVSRLLVRLQMETAEQAAEETVTRAWRAYELTAEMVSHNLMSEVYTQALVDAHKGLSEAVSPEDNWWGKPRFAPTVCSVPQEDLDAGKIPDTDPWEAFKAPEAVETMAAPKRWESALSAAGATFARNLTEVVLPHAASKPPESRPQVLGEVESVWACVHQDPKYVYAGLLQDDLGRALKMAEQLEQTSGHWADVRQSDRRREDLVRQARDCAVVMTEAQDGFVERWFRIAFALVVALFVAYFCALLTHTLLGSMFYTFIVVVAATVGAMLAALLPHALERWRGEKAKGDFRSKVLPAIDDETKKRHEHCQKAVQGANEFWQRLRARGAAERLQRLLTRTRNVLDHELGPQAPAVSRLGDGEPNSSSEAATWRREFCTRTCLRYPRAFRLEDLDKTHMAQSVAAGVSDFRDRLWKEFCATNDKKFAGALPVHILIPAIRDFRARFRMAILLEIYRQAIEKVSDDDLRTWIDEVRRNVQGQPFYYYMSCQMAKRDTDGLTRKLILRPSLARRDLFAGDFSHDFSIERLDVLERLQVAGYYYEEAKVQFGAEAGLIRVKPYEASAEVGPSVNEDEAV